MSAGTLSFATPIDRASALEKHYSVHELSEIWGLSGWTVKPMFASEPGVLRIGEGRPRTRRPYITLRIPESVAIRVHAAYAGNRARR